MSPIRALDVFPASCFPRWFSVGGEDPPEGSGAGAKFLVAAGPPSDQILRGAHEHFADRIVMGTQGLRKRDRLIVGCTVKRVVLAAPCPVLSIHAAA